MSSFESLARILRALLAAARWAGLVFVVFAIWFVAREVHDLYRLCADVHLAFGIAFLILFAVAFWWLVIRHAVRYLRMPAAVRPPDVPAGDTPQRAVHVLRRARGIESYVANLLANPNLEAQRVEITAALTEVRALRQSGDAAEQLQARLTKFEHDRLDPLLRPLDDRAREIVRREAMAVAVATAVSPSGAIDSFFVLWRNANMVASLAQLYYGRPGVRGTLLVLRDVSFAMFVASQMQGLAEKGVQTAGGFLGKAVSPFAGPIADGVVNGAVTMRVGYLAMRRCRAFRAFTEQSVGGFLGDAFREAAKQSVGLARDLVSEVGMPVLKMPVEAGKKLVDWVADSVRGWVGGRRDGPDAAPGTS
jgi:hypothetical protein